MSTIILMMHLQFKLLEHLTPKVNMANRYNTCNNRGYDLSDRSAELTDIPVFPILY